jgi:hypothetical protein
VAADRRTSDTGATEGATEMRGTKTTGLAKVAGIGIVAIGIALGSVSSASASALTKRFDDGDTGGVVGIRKLELIEIVKAEKAARPHQTRFRVGFLPE